MMAIAHCPAPEYHEGEEPEENGDNGWCGGVPHCALGVMDLLWETLLALGLLEGLWDMGRRWVRGYGKPSCHVNPFASEGILFSLKKNHEWSNVCSCVWRWSLSRELLM